MLFFPPNYAQIMLTPQICALGCEKHAWLYLEKSSTTYAFMCFSLNKTSCELCQLQNDKMYLYSVKHKQLFKVIIDCCIAA